MPVKCDEYNETCVITVTGDLVGEDVQTVSKHAEKTFDERRVVDFVIDLEKSGFIDGEGLETLLWLHRTCESHHGQVKLAALDDNVRKILEITRLSHRFETHPDVTAALRSMR
jgi:anti-anti-sigma factor